MFRGGQEIDAKEQSAIGRRKDAEAQRKQRIFNPRVRTMGVDVDGLAEQIRLKKEREDLEKHRDLMYAEEMKRVAGMLEKREAEVNMEKKEMANSLNQYRREHQQYTDRREFDLNRKDFLASGVPTRAGDHDATLSVSGLQVMDGEDLQGGERSALQKQQRLRWAQQQISEREAKKEAERLEEEAFGKYTRELAARQDALEKDQDDARRELAKYTSEYNRALAAEKKQREAEAAASDVNNNLEEINGTLTSALMSEDPHQSAGVNGRTVVQHYKGMSSDDIDHIRETQRLQKDISDQKKADELAEQAAWDAQVRRQERALRKQELLAQQEARENARRLNEENASLAAAKKSKYEQMYRKEDQQAPGDGFFGQFSTTTR